MASTANNDAYGNGAWRSAPWGSSHGAGRSQAQWDDRRDERRDGTRSGQPGWADQAWSGPGWGGPSGWHPARLGKIGSIALVILGFMIWWPIGLAALAYMIGSGRMGCWGRRRFAGQQAGWQGSPWSNWMNWCAGGPAATQSSGNRAFDEYRTETLRRLEEEQKEFGTFLDRLRFAKDKAEFDQFMAERRQVQRPSTPPAEEPPAA